MGLTIEGVKDYKGFRLSEPIIFETDIIVLTGKNGSGKTRLLESIKSQNTNCYFESNLVHPAHIMLIQKENEKQSQQIESNYDHSFFEHHRDAIKRGFSKIKDDLSLSFEDLTRKYMGFERQDPEINLSEIYNLCIRSSKKLKKPLDELVETDLELFCDESNGNLFIHNKISYLCNQYIRKKNQNQYFEWLSKEKGKKNHFFTDIEFIRTFGEQPLILANTILKNVFDGKFQFNLPDEESDTYNYQAKLIQVNNSQTINSIDLSSGEKTLLWLAMTLFNSIYYDLDEIYVPKIILIDEPDSFLHPKLIEKMYQTFQLFSDKFNIAVIFTTHSPTTVALAPDKNVFVVADNTISPVSKDEGITELLDGITQISINPENRRQVFVESQYDADIYQAIYGKLAGNSRIDPKISLNFVSSGPKMPEQQLKDKAKQILKIDDDEQLREFVEAVNGIGSCSHVEGAVESLRAKGSNTVKGIIDWDTKNTSKEHVVVFAEEYAYSIENVVLDPISILLLLHINQPGKITMTDICDENIHWLDWLENDDLLQKSIDRFISNVLGRENLKNCDLQYVSSERIFLSDTDYLMMKGHELEELIKKAYPGLNAFARTGKDGELKYEVVSRGMIHYTKGKFIPQVFEKILLEVQK